MQPTGSSGLVPMNVMSWYGLVGTTLWICGLAVCLATLGMAYFEARAAEDRLRHRLGEREPQMATAVGLILFCAGLLLGSDTWWEKGIWGVCVALGIVWLIRQWGRFGADRGGGA